MDYVKVLRGQRGEGREEGAFLLYIWMVTWSQVKMGGKHNGFWEYGGCCLGNRCSGPSYVMSLVSEVLIPTQTLLETIVVWSNA